MLCYFLPLVDLVCTFLTVLLQNWNFVLKPFCYSTQIQNNYNKKTQLFQNGYDLHFNEILTP